MVKDAVLADTKFHSAETTIRVFTITQLFNSACRYRRSKLVVG
jgi:hypothetical protein